MQFNHERFPAGLRMDIPEQVPIPSLLWSKEIRGTVAYADANSLITSPENKFAYHCVGGWWSRYRRDNGELIWRRHHRRGSVYFGLVSDVIIATTYHAGIYGISFISGRKLWTRLGDSFDWFLKLLDCVPGLDNEGDRPVGIVHQHVLSVEGRLIDRNTGRILSRHHLETYVEESEAMARGAVGYRATIDGQIFDFSPRLKQQETEFLNCQKMRDEIQKILAQENLELSGDWNCIQEYNSMVFFIACNPPDFDHSVYQTRLQSGVKTIDVRHFLMVMRRIDSVIIHREEIGFYYQASFSWCNQGLLTVELQTKKQWNWGNRCDLRVYDLYADRLFPTN